MVNYLITAPTQDVVTLEEVKAQLRLSTSGTSNDTLLGNIVDAVVALLDPASGGYLDRALRPQTWELRLPSFCQDGKEQVFLPFPPLISITSVKYDDVGGTERTLALTSGYRLFGAGKVQGKAYLMPPYLQSWPTTRCDAESVRIRYQAGYDNSTDDTMPAAIKQAVHLSVRNLWNLGERSLYESESVVDGVGSKRWVVSDLAAQVIKDASDNLLAPYRVW